MRNDTARVFVSFDRSHDGDLRDRLLAEAKTGALFSVSACSDRALESDAGIAHVRDRIADVDAVIVICGEFTDDCASVSAELRITHEEQKPHLLLWGRRASMCKKPTGARPDDSIYGWTPEILRMQLQFLMRTTPDVPAHLRRQPSPPKVDR